jgi:hypothetical protein
LKHIFIIFIITFLFNPLHTDAQELLSPALKVNPAFLQSEKLTYQIRYGIVVGGSATLSVSDTVYNGVKVFHALAVGQTTGLANTLYGVRDIYESWFSKKTNLPLKAASNIKEGHYKHTNEVTFDRDNNEVMSKLTGVHRVPEKILDLSSMLYYLRRVDYSCVNLQDTIFVNMYFADEIYPFHLVFNGKETVRTIFGKVSCIKLTPIVEVGRMFKSPNDLTIWLTDDNNCIPVLIRMDIRIVGAVYIKLIKFENILKPSVFQEQTQN